MSKIRDKFWIWGHEAGSHNNNYGITASSRMTPVEAAFYMGIPNVIMVRYEGKPAPPFEQHAIALSSLKHVVWSIVGSSGQYESNEVALVRDLASRFPNFCGVIMDDFFGDMDKIAVFTPEEIQGIKKQLTVTGRKLDLWVVVYSSQAGLPIGRHLEQCDVVTFWTWHAKDIKNLEENFERVEKLSPSCRKVLGCYMYDYGDKKPMPVHLMEKQCQLGLQWLRQGRIKGMIFLASCICDLGLEAVEWTRQWIQGVGEESLSPTQ